MSWEKMKRPACIGLSFSLRKGKSMAETPRQVEIEKSIHIL